MRKFIEEGTEKSKRDLYASHLAARIIQSAFISISLGRLFTIWSLSPGLEVVAGHWVRLDSHSEREILLLRGCF